MIAQKLSEAPLVVLNKQDYPLPQGFLTSADAFASVAPAVQGILSDRIVLTISFFRAR